MSGLLSFKLQLVLVSHAFHLGIFRVADAQKNKQQLALSLQLKLNGPVAKVNVEGGPIDKEIYPSQNLPAGPLNNAVVEVDTVARTIRFLINDQQMHDGDIPIQWNADVLQEMFFFVRLFERGDCVRIVD